MDTALRLTFLALAGAAGTLARYFVYVLVSRWTFVRVVSASSSPARVSEVAHGPADTAVATLLINVLGSLAFGVIWSLAEEHGRLSPQTKWLLLTGFMGAFTTFSTFAFETGRLMSDGRIGLALLNLAANNVLGIGAFLVGWWVVRWVWAA